VIKYQILTEVMFFNKETLIPSDLEILTLLAALGPIDLGGFCLSAAKTLHPDSAPEDISVRSQNVRNRIVKLEKRNIVVKTNAGRKVIEINPSYNIVSNGNILLDYNYLSVESN
jgi:hypothetical protein